MYQIKRDWLICLALILPEVLIVGVLILFLLARDGVAL